MLDEFYSFVQQRRDVLADQQLNNNAQYRGHLRNSSAFWNTISDIAKKLHFSPCSEASCERIICTQRVVSTVKRMSCNKDLHDVRLTVIQGFNILDD